MKVNGIEALRWVAGEINPDEANRFVGLWFILRNIRCKSYQAHVTWKEPKTIKNQEILVVGRCLSTVMGDRCHFW